MRAPGAKGTPEWGSGGLGAPGRLALAAVPCNGKGVDVDPSG